MLRFLPFYLLNILTRFLSFLFPGQDVVQLHGGCGVVYLRLVIQEFSLFGLQNVSFGYSVKGFGAILV